MRNTTGRSVVRITMVRGTVAALAAASLALGVSPGHAAPKGKIGPVQNLTVEITKPSAYKLTANWDALERATSYRVSLSSGGSVLASDKMTQTSWVVNPPVTAGRTVTVKVVPLNQNRPGKPASVNKVVPDLTAPTGTYSVSLDVRTATVTETDLTDDLSLDAVIDREIDWDDNGSGWQAWDTGTTSAHTYQPGKAAYHPRVRLTDEAGNPEVLLLDAVAIDDTEAPEGTFTASSGSAWAKYTKVTVTQVGELSDDVSAAANITRVVDWKDGTTSPWTEGTTPQHVYATAGNYTPIVRLTDESGKTANVSTSEIGVQADSVAPRASLTKPAKVSSVRAWKRLKGKAKDVAGTGVRNVTVRIVEKRNGRWFAYRATSRTWVKASSKAAALRNAKAAKVAPVDGIWRYSVRRLSKGAIVVQVRGTDNVGNRSKFRTYSQLLNRR